MWQTKVQDGVLSILRGGLLAYLCFGGAESEEKARVGTRHILFTHSSTTQMNLLTDSTTSLELLFASPAGTTQPEEAHFRMKCPTTWIHDLLSHSARPQLPQDLC